MRRDDGFTLIELLTAMTITALLLALSAAPLRTYWLTQSLEGATDSVVTQLREQQEDAVSQAFPRIFGARFTAGSSDWTLLRFDPSAVAPTPRCTSEPRTFAADGVFSGTVVVKSVTVTNDAAAPEYTECASSGDKIIFFYPRGTSTGGTVILEQPSIGRERTITVGVATGRVDRS